MALLPKLSTSFQQGGLHGIALLGPGSSQPDVAVQGLQLAVGLQVQLREKDPSVSGEDGHLQVQGVVAGWNGHYQCWFATYDWDALTWTPESEADAAL